MTKPEQRLIVALDTADLNQAEELLKQLKGVASFYKVGFELFTAFGWRAVELVQKYGGKVFLDLKLHDIPNTVAKTARVLCKHQIAMTTIHTLGGFEMMKAAAQAVRESTVKPEQKCLLMGVTILTSHSEKQLTEEMGVQKPLETQVLDLARLAYKAGIDGVVSSGHEIKKLKKEVGPEFLVVCPGIRPTGSQAQDQKRVFTPEEAISAGADYLVVGRPITSSSVPKKVASDIVQSITAAGRSSKP